MKKFTEADRSVVELFENYVREWVVSTFDALTPPQREAWPLIAEGKNTLIFSPTGSGKTLAAFLFCINELFKLSIENNLKDTIYVLYVSPLRALSNDIHKNLYEPLRGIYSILKSRNIHCTPIHCQVRTGDTTATERASMARNPPHILITTPETLYIILTTKKFRENLKNIQYVIVDEIHALAGSKRGVQLSLSLERLVSLLGRTPVRIGLSATQSPVEEIARFLVGMEDGIPRPCEIVNIGARKHLDLQVISPVDNLLEAKNDVVWNAAYLKLIDLIQTHDTTLIFTSSRYRTEHTALQLRELGEEQGLKIGSHHGSMSRLIRHDIEERLKKNELDAVIATSSLELGIDIGSIDLVCNVESPKSLSSGMQRIGRAGHLLKETSKGRIVATDPDDLVESAVLVRGIANSIIDTTRIPLNALDILAQQIVACAAADDWDATELYDMVKRSYCYATLKREDFDSVVEMLSSQISRTIYPKIHYDRVNKKITGGRGSRTIAFRCGGAIPDVTDYGVFQGPLKIGTLDEGFVERIRPGDVFILGSQAWQVAGIDRKKVSVQNVAGVPPTIPYWGGPRPSRTYDLGVLVGKFRKEMGRRINSNVEHWLMSEYFLDRDGASAVSKYYKEQYLVMGVIPSFNTIVVESFRNELGQQQMAVHSSFGVKVNDIWGYALMTAARKAFNVKIGVATVDDGILLTMPGNVYLEPEAVFSLVDTTFMTQTAEEIITSLPVFTSRFRHCAVRAFLILREYSGKKVPVWLQSVKAAELLAEFPSGDFPMRKEAFRESVEDAIDLPHLLEILTKIERKEISVIFCETKIPSPFIHQLLMVGQFGDFGRISNEERKLRLIHLHRQVLKQLVDEDLIKNLLVEKEITRLEKEMQFLLENQKARTKDELARIIQSLGDLTTEEVRERVRHAEMAESLLGELCDEKRVVQVLIPFAVPEERWIPTELFSVYKAAFARRTKEKRSGSTTARKHAFELLKIMKGTLEVVTEEWVPQEFKMEKDHIYSQVDRVKNFLAHRGPVARYELMERYGLSSESVVRCLGILEGQDVLSQGSFVGTKDSPQWCWKSNLEELHRRSLYSLREKVKPLPLERYIDFMLKWQHLHPKTKLKGKEGVFTAIKQLQTWEEHITCWERYLLGARVLDYNPQYLDELICEKRVSFGRFNPLPDHEMYSLPNRGIIQLYCREDADFVVNSVVRVEYFEDLKKECEETMEVLKIWPSLSLEAIITGTQMDRDRICRAVLRLFQLGVLENTSYDTVRESIIVSGMSAAWDVTHTPGEVSDHTISMNVRKKRIRLDKGKWALIGRGRNDLLERVRQIFRRYGIVTRELLKVNKEAVTLPEFMEASKILLLRGEIREGRFIEGLEGIQYAVPEAVEVLRTSDVSEVDDEFVVANMKDPANLYGKLVPIVDAEGDTVKHSVALGNHVVIRRGAAVVVLTTKNVPGRYFDVRMNILVDIPKEDLIALVKRVVEYTVHGALQRRFKFIRFTSFNEESVVGSGLDQILEALGFSLTKNGLVLSARTKIEGDGEIPDSKDIPEIFQRMRPPLVTVQ